MTAVDDGVSDVIVHTRSTVLYEKYSTEAFTPVSTTYLVTSCLVDLERDYEQKDLESISIRLEKLVLSSFIWHTIVMMRPSPGFISTHCLPTSLGETV